MRLWAAFRGERRQVTDLPIVIEELPISSGVASLGTEYRVRLNERVALQFERFDDYFAAYWRSKISLSRFYGIIRDMSIPDDAETWQVVPHSPRDESYRHTTLSESGIWGSASDPTFVRVDVSAFGLTWQRYEPDEKRVVGFIGGTASISVLRFFFAKTSEIPAHEVLEPLLARVGYSEE